MSFADVSAKAEAERRGRAPASLKLPRGNPHVDVASAVDRARALHHMDHPATDEEVAEAVGIVRTIDEYEASLPPYVRRAVMVGIVRHICAP